MLTLVADLRARSAHVLREPVEHGLRAALELQLAVEPGRGVLDPVQLLLGHRDVVEHRLDVTGVGEDVAADLAEEVGTRTFLAHSAGSAGRARRWCAAG